MSASFHITLDTVTHVAAAINGGKSTTGNPTVTLELDLDPDAALVKIWGDINPLDPMNAGMGTSEEGAEWLEASTDWLVALTTNPGAKELHVAVRDDVDNEARASASISLEGEGPPVPPIEPEPTHPEPLPASGLPEPRVEPERREVATTSGLAAVSSTATVAARRPITSSIGAAPVSSSAVHATSASRTQISTRVDNSVRARVLPLRQGVPVGSSVATVERRDGAEFIASLIELGIL